MRSVVEEKRVEALVVHIEWERIFMKIDLKVQINDNRVDLSK